MCKRWTISFSRKKSLWADVYEDMQKISLTFYMNHSVVTIGKFQITQNHFLRERERYEI